MMRKKMIAGGIMLIALLSCSKAKVEPTTAITTTTGADTTFIPNCDTSGIVSYAQDIQKILNHYCVECHNAPNDQFDFSHYSSTVVAVAPGALMGAILHDPNSGYNPMPLKYTTVNGTTTVTHEMMDSCSINQIQKWINEGSPDN